MTNGYRPDEIEKFKARLKIDPATGCMEWTGYVRKRGGKHRHQPYGDVWFDGRNRLAHRVAMMIETGQDIPPGMTVMHQCDNPPCCNPDHLRIGTQSENVIDAYEKGRRRTGRVPGAAIPDDEVRAMAATALPISQLRKDFHRCGYAIAAAFDRLGLTRPEWSRPVYSITFEDIETFAALGEPTMAGLARRVGVSRTTLQDAFRRYGLPLPGQNLTKPTE